MTCPYATEDLGKFETLKGCCLISSRMGIDSKKQYWHCPNRISEEFFRDCFTYMKQQALELEESETVG